MKNQTTVASSRWLAGLSKAVMACAACWLLIWLLAPSDAVMSQQPAPQQPATQEKPPATTSPPQGSPADGSLDGLLEGLGLGQGGDAETPNVEEALPSTDPASATRPTSPQGPTGSASGVGSASGSRETSPLWEAYQAMLAAKVQLAADDFGPSTQAQQQRAVDLLDLLLDSQASDEPQALQQDPSQSQGEEGQSAGEQSGSPPQQSASEQSSSEQPSVDGEGEQQPESEEDRSGSGENGGEGEAASPEAIAAAGTKQPLEAAGEAVWGHLPERMRGRLRAERPTEYLPRYSKEISEYFRALAELPKQNQ